MERPSSMNICFSSAWLADNNMLTAGYECLSMPCTDPSIYTHTHTHTHTHIQCQKTHRQITSKRKINTDWEFTRRAHTNLLSQSSALQSETKDIIPSKALILRAPPPSHRLQSSAWSRRQSSAGTGSMSL